MTISRKQHIQHGRSTLTSIGAMYPVVEEKLPPPKLNINVDGMPDPKKRSVGYAICVTPGGDIKESYYLKQNKSAADVCKLYKIHVVIRGKIYRSVKEAAADIGISRTKLTCLEKAKGGLNKVWVEI